METPLVSVIIPCYNQGQYLQEAIKSVLKQTYKSREIIVIDDGSKDNTREVSESFTEVKYIFQHNQGVCAARNQGISIAKGKYLVFLDADDKLLENALKVGVHALETHNDAGMTFGRAYCQDQEGSVKRASPEVKTCSYADLLSFNTIWHPACAMFRTKALASIGNFDTTLVNCGDYDIYLKLSRIYQIHCTPQFISTYISTENSLSTNKLRAFRYMFQIRRSHVKYVRHIKELSKAYQEGNYFYQSYYGTPLFSKLLDILKNHDFKSPLLQEILREFIVHHPRWFILKVIRYCITKITGGKLSPQVG
ncbi:MAG: glycosyltransferase [Gloeomargaritaceae cyanobacterium C42_A2020_066]|nr:glycosyltransferase [Gloeomargaritaceae cyanobacterium C42_A2020_066]